MKTKNTTLAILFLFALSIILPSCSTTQDCWAYRSCGAKNQYNNSKKRPSVVSAGGNKSRCKVRY